jgi:hypothetical protein
MADPQPPSPAPSIRQVTYFAVSFLASRTVWVNFFAFLAAASTLTEFTNVIPVPWQKPFFALVALGNLWLRFNTVRPIAFIAPGETQAVLVPRVGPPAPAKLGD